MARTLPSLPPIVQTLNRRGRRRRRRRTIWEEHTHRTDQGVFRPTLAENAGICRPTRPRNAPVGRQVVIAYTASDEDAKRPVSALGGKRQDDRQRGGKGLEGGMAQGAALTFLEAARKNLRHARATITTPAEKVVATEDGKGAAGDLTGYVPTGEYRRIQEVYGDWVHSNYGDHLSGGIADDKDWHTRWITLAVMFVRHYNTPSRRVRCRFVHMLAAELIRVW